MIYIADFIKNNIKFQTDYKDSHCDHEIRDDDDHLIGRRHEDSKMTITLTNKGNDNGIRINGQEIITTECFVQEEDPDCNGAEHQNFILNDPTSNIVRDGDKIETHTGEIVTLQGNLSSNVHIGKKVNIGKNKNN